MQQQLLKAPQRVYRQSAENGEGCPRLTKMHPIEKVHGHTQVAERSLFCSNYDIWEKASKSDAEFILVLEDDAILLPDFWPKLYDFVQGCNSMDYAVVDPMLYRPRWPRDFWKINAEPAQ